MRRILLSSVALILTLVGGSMVWAEDGFYVVGAQRGNYAPVPKTGQTTTRAAGDDGALQKGVASPSSRFNDNNNGTVTDKLTGLIWLKNANSFGQRTWDQALSDAAALADGNHDLHDGSQVGDWRLPNVRELQSLVDYGNSDPALPASHPFSEVQPDFYWLSTTYSFDVNRALELAFTDGLVLPVDKGTGRYVWCVRGGK